MWRIPAAAMLLIVQVSTALAAGNAETGGLLAQRWCSGCHAVPAARTASDAAPSLRFGGQGPQGGSDMGQGLADGSAPADGGDQSLAPADRGCDSLPSIAAAELIMNPLRLGQASGTATGGCLQVDG
jgi:hypothetical protein